MIFAFILGATISLLWAAFTYISTLMEIERHNASPLGRLNPITMQIDVFIIVVRTLAMGGVFAIIAHIM